jgi:hypothetical protein
MVAKPVTTVSALRSIFSMHAFIFLEIVFSAGKGV